MAMLNNHRVTWNLDGISLGCWYELLGYSPIGVLTYWDIDINLFGKKIHWEGKEFGWNIIGDIDMNLSIFINGILTYWDINSLTSWNYLSSG